MENMPEIKFDAGAIVATVWKNKANSGEGEFKTVGFERRYKDKDGKWKNSNTLRINDLPKAIMVLQKAYEYLTLKGAE